MLSDLLISPNPNAVPDYGVLDAGILALIGYAIVFLGIALLLVVVVLVSKFFTRKVRIRKEKKTKVVASAEAAAAAVVSEPQVAPGTAGQLKLHDVPPKTAAMLMAIVADKLGKPLNELRFISIKEVK